MTVKCNGAITYKQAVAQNGKVKITIEGTVKITKGTLDWMGILAWQTGWRFYDPYGKLLHSDNRSHAIAPFATYDEATDSFAVSLPTYNYYNIQLLGPCAGVLATERVYTNAEPVVQPAPYTPAPVPTEPSYPVTPSTTPEGPTTPTFPALSEIPSWLPLVGIGAIILFLVLRK